MKETITQLLSTLKNNKVLMNKDVEKTVYRSVQNNIKIKNVAAIYNFSHLFNSSNVSKLSLQFIELCFQMLVDSTSFLELEFKLVSKILSSSELNIDSEMEVFNAIVLWLGHNEEHSKYAKGLILKVRLSLLSDPALKLITEKISCFIDDFAFINEVITVKNKGLNLKYMKTLSRYCTHNNFNIFFCGGKNLGSVVRDVYSIKAHKLKSVEKLPNLNEGRQWHEVVCIKGEIFVFGGKDIVDNCITSIEKYSSYTNAWEIIAKLPVKRFKFCACSFMGNAYILGGFIQVETLNSCLMFTTADYSWKEVAEMNESRCFASCVVFEGKIVVSGGYNNRRLNTVEAYDHVANTWTNMPNMVEERYYHKSVAVKNKLFLIDGDRTKTCEVYDSTCKKFVLLKTPNNCLVNYKNLEAVITIGSKLYVFHERKSTCLTYDIENDTWSEESCEINKILLNFSCAKLPQL